MLERDNDIMCFSETWLQPNSIEDNFLAIPSFSAHRRDRVTRSHGGGLLVYVKSALRNRRRVDLEDEAIESIALELSLSTPKHLFFFCYRPPNQSPELFFNTLSRLLAAAEAKNNVVTLLGDFNAKHVSWDPESSPNVAGLRLSNLFLDFSLHQCVNTPTRFSPDGESRSVLDLYATNRPDLILDIHVSDMISDHCCVTTRVHQKVRKKRRETVSFFDFKNADWSGLRAALSRASLRCAIQGTDDVNIAWNVWASTLSEIARRFIPKRTITIRPKNKPWMTSALHQITKRKNRLFKIAKVTRSPTDWQKYKTARNKCTETFRNAKAEYLHRKHEELAKQSNGDYRWWRLAKQMAKISSPKSHLTELEDEGSIISHPSEKADLLARFFSKQCSMNSDSMADEALCGAPYPLSERGPSFNFPPITEQIVLRHLQRLPVHRSTADDLFTNHLLRECACFVADSLSYLYNLSVSTSNFPSDWKKATVIPIFKLRGSPRDPSNYRPVSLLPSVGKLLDAILSERLLNFLVTSNQLNQHQFGFMPNRSTVTQLVFVVDKWIRALDNSHATVAVFMDFMKAFDRVWHRGLLHKLATLGVLPESLGWLRSYLRDRQLSVRVGTVLSEPHSINAGVPQGSHLGPVLFLVFANDLPDAVGLPTELYADDTLIHIETSLRYVDTQFLGTLQSAIDRAADWADSWHGRFSNSKTKILAIKRSRTGHSEAFVFPNSSPTLEGQSIDLINSHRHLGVVLTESLDWKEHISGVLKRSSRRAGLLRWMSRDLHPNVTKTLYIHYVRPTMEYASSVWHFALREEETLALERVQASVARSILRAPWDTPKAVLLKTLNWPALRWRRTILSMCLFHKLVHERAPPLDQCIFPFSRTVTTRTQRKPFQLVLGNATTKQYLRSFFFSCSILWNTLPHDLQALSHTRQFKQKLMDHFESTKYDPSFKHTQ